MKTIAMSIFLIFTTSLSLASECIMTSRIRGFNVEDNSHLTIDAGREHYYMRVSYCRDLQWAHRIAFRTFSRSRVCPGDRLLVLDNFSNRIVNECYIHDIY